MKLKTAVLLQKRGVKLRFTVKTEAMLCSLSSTGHMTGHHFKVETGTTTLCLKQTNFRLRFREMCLLASFEHVNKYERVLIGRFCAKMS